ncbi:DNA cytosine methyltransferase [Streptomonospora litoralis]|uniref:DNA (cytosine-5-)-methyltransferase n=1 Tax=Streptomonospora litoralis TaxID=2498135 RepID=A0A4P6Q9J4_9ACTN|nr:DNA cytosine methyltransferase [Streptomonospora litoralis]QBI56291.1 Modification methylase AplI [Streptomonospora litoralis]
MAGSDQEEYTSIEICAGAGGQALGLEQAGFHHKALIEVDSHACETLRRNAELRAWGEPEKLVLREDLTEFGGAELLAQGYAQPGELALLAGGVPCPPFSFAGKRLGRNDERDLFPAMLKLVESLQPRAVMIENVRGLLEPADKFADYRVYIEKQLEGMGYTVLGWEVLEAKEFEVPQLRPRAVLVAMRDEEAPYFKPIRLQDFSTRTVLAVLEDSMRERFKRAKAVVPKRQADAAFEKWKQQAAEKGTVAPTLVGGSKKHGGADLGPTRAKKAWAELGIDANGVANDPEMMVDAERDLLGPVGPKLTVQQAALIQGFPEDYFFSGGKTARYRQVGNAFPPPVACAVAEAVYAALHAYDNRDGSAIDAPQRRLVCREEPGQAGGTRQLQQVLAF